MLNNTSLYISRTYWARTLDAHSGLATTQPQATSSWSDLVKGFIDFAEFQNHIRIWQAAKHQGEHLSLFIYL